jgi:protein TonB
VKGRIKDSDYPRGAGEAGISGKVAVRFSVETNGHATNCSVTRSSGNAELDEATCRLIETRFRYKPATDAAGRPVRSTIVSNHYWIIHHPGDPEPPDDEPDDGN